jgi:hypothetical protein
MPYSRFCKLKKCGPVVTALIACLGLAFHGQVALAAQHQVEPEPTSNQCYHRPGANSSLTDPAAIQALAAEAYIWALAPEFVYRFLNYNTLKTAPVNKLAGITEAAGWNNPATNAGDASVLYLNAMINLSGKQTEGGATELVLTVPPSLDPKDPTSKERYIVVDFLDQYINTVGSIGTRTTPSTETQTYLIAGPQSIYQHDTRVTIGGKEFRVLPTGTNLNWMLIRIRADTLAPSSGPNSFPSSSTANIYPEVVQKFALNTLDEYLKNGNQPILQSSFQYPFTKQQLKRSQDWRTQPCSNPDTCTVADAVEFFQQAGCSLVISPMPSADFGINFTPLTSDFPEWIAPQDSATTVYVNPSFGQQATLDRFARLGLTANGYAVPRNWGPQQLNALMAGLLAGLNNLNQKLSTSPGKTTNFWNYINANVGTYSNSPQGYLNRGAIVLAGGSANLPEDAIYSQTNFLGGSNTQLSGGNTYTLKFTTPIPTGSPANGTIPPLSLDENGNPDGFWSLHVYQPDATESAAPFLMQTASLNTAYSNANLNVLSVVGNSITACDTEWALMKASSPVFFSANAYGLIPGKPYYIIGDPTRTSGSGTSCTNSTGTITFQVSVMWKQELSPASATHAPVPMQNSVDPAGPGSVFGLLAVSGPFQPFQWGPIQSVSQLGSQQITSGLLQADSDSSGNKSYTIWVAPPSNLSGANLNTWVPAPPLGVDPHNWIPTPSSDYYNLIYGANSGVSTDIRLMIRMYDPAPGCPPPSILPPIDENGVSCSKLPPAEFDATYAYPLVNKQ